MLDFSYYFIVSFCILLFAISKSGFSGGGLALISVTVLSITYGPLTAIAILMPMLIVCDAIAAFLNRKYYDHKAVWSIAPFSLLGVIAGTILFKFINLSLISVFIGSISLAYVISNYLLTQSKIKKIPFYGSKTIWGTLAGFTSFVSHAGGPPAAVYLLSKRPNKTEFQATTVIIFWAINLAKAVPYAFLGLFTLETLTLNVALAPFALIGVWMGVKAHHWVSDRLFFALTYALLTVTGLRLIWMAVT